MPMEVPKSRRGKDRQTCVRARMGSLEAGQGSPMQIPRAEVALPCIVENDSTTTAFSWPRIHMEPQKQKHDHSCYTIWLPLTATFFRHVSIFTRGSFDWTRPIQRQQSIPRPQHVDSVFSGDGAIRERVVYFSTHEHRTNPVSYTHLTLPTKRIV